MSENKNGQPDQLDSLTNALRMSSDHLTELLSLQRVMDGRQATPSIERALEAHEKIFQALVGHIRGQRPDLSREQSTQGKHITKEIIPQLETSNAKPLVDNKATRLGPLPRFVPLGTKT